MLFLLVGQSNMAGRGKVEDEDRKPHARVLTLDKTNKWAPAIDPLHFDKSIAGVGLGKTFGQVVADANPESTIGLIPCAVGGTSIDRWAPERKPADLFAAAIERAKIALKDGQLAGILWHQGESDSKKLEGYTEKAVAMFGAFRKLLADAKPVPIVVGEIGRFHANQEAVNAVIRALPKSIPACAAVEATNLNHKGDSVHFDSAAYRELGRRYAAQWQALSAAAK